MNINIKKSLKITLKETLLAALQRMDENRCKLLLISNPDNEYHGLLSIGDIQRALLNNVSLDNSVEKILRNDYVVADTTMSLEDIKKLMLKIRAEFMPVITEDNKIEKIYFWSELFEPVDEIPVNQFSLPVVVMAGGFGTRLKPLTNVLPKPLIPIGDKTMIEEIMERFGTHGCNTFHISVNYKAELIEYYLKEQNLPFNLTYFKEEKPMGTGGSLSLLKGKINETFFVSNCDILIDQDYFEVLKYHRENKNEITVIAAMKTYPIAYGTIETGQNGKLLNMVEKPELTFKINTGMYILEPHLLDDIPDETFFHITELIDNVGKRGGKVGVFPVSEKSWIDIGNWDEYFKNYNNDK